MKQLKNVLLALALCAFASAAFAMSASMGPAGTFSEAAAATWFAGTDEQVELLKTVPECVAGLKEGKYDFAVIPLENTKGGLAGAAGTLYIDLADAGKDLRVVGQVDVGIRQMLMGVEAATLDTIKTVVSHNQGLTQGKEWLAQNMPNVTFEQSNSTAGAAKMAAEKNDPTVAAIAAPRAAEVYGLKIIAPDIQITRANVTRFWVLAKPEKAAAVVVDAALPVRTALAVSGPAAGLPAALAAMNEAGLKLAAIHERCTKAALGEYVWIAEFENAGAAVTEEQIAKAAAGTGMTVTFMGTYNCRQ